MKKNLRNLSKYTLGIAAITLSTGFALAADSGTGTAVDVKEILNISATARSLLNGPAALIIDAIILAGAGYGAAQTRSPAPVVFGLISCGIFHLAVKALIPAVV